MSAEAEVTWIVNAQVLNPQGRFEPRAIGVRGGEITAVQTQPDPAGSVHYDASGGYVVPGLIDVHSHLSHYHHVSADSEGIAALKSAYRARLALRAGITTVRDIGSHRRTDVALRDAIRAGYTVGPDMMCAGSFVAMTGGHDHKHAWVCDGEDGVRKGVREQLALGVDWIKLMCSGGFAAPGERYEAPQLTFAEISAAVSEAADQGVSVAAHAHPATAIKRALQAGVKSIEHGSFVDAECLELLHERDAFIVPTFHIYELLAQARPELAEHAAFVVATKIKSFQGVLESGVRWGVGSDCGEGSAVRSMVGEMLFLHEKVGLSAAEVLHHSSAGNAALLDLDDRGAIAPGQRADLVVLDENPLEDLQALDRARATLLRGQVFEWADRGAYACAGRFELPDPGFM